MAYCENKYQERKKNCIGGNKKKLLHNLGQKKKKCIREENNEPKPEFLAFYIKTNNIETRKDILKKLKNIVNQESKSHKAIINTLIQNQPIPLEKVEKYKNIMKKYLKEIEVDTSCLTKLNCGYDYYSQKPYTYRWYID